jgi:ABC-2 type transport system permease protein
MSTVPTINSLDLSVPMPLEMPWRRVLNAYLQEARSEILRYLRLPSFLLPVMLFPAAFYLMFGVVMGARNGADAPRFLLAAYSTFGVMAPGLYGFGVSLALERDGGLLTLKRALPMPPAAYLLGKMAMAVIAAGGVVVLLQLLATFLAHVSLAWQQSLALQLTGMLGVLPFCALGFLIGTLVKGQGAPGMINLIYLPMSFLSGLWFPLSMMPAWMRALAPIWPSHHVNLLAMSAIGFNVGPRWPHVLVLLAMTTVFLLLAARRLRRLG